MVATFEMPPEVAKQDVHISFQRNRVVITWSYAEIIEWKENGVFNKERIEKYYNRTLPLPEGTRVGGPTYLDYARPINSPCVSMKRSMPK